MKVFISHVTEEAPIALQIRDFINDISLGQIGAFASSHVHDMTPGHPWLETIDSALRNSNLLLTICSPSSLTRPWINFEVGCAWASKIKIIPICHSGQRKDQLPFPFSIFPALQLEDEAFLWALSQGLEECFNAIHTSPIHLPQLGPERLRKSRRDMDRARDSISVTEALPQIIHSPRERTQLIINDLKILLRSHSPTQETVWTSAFLSSFAIGPDAYPNDQKDYLKLLTQERDLLLDLARRGCTIKCIISPANKNYIRHAGVDNAIKRTRRLLELLRSGDNALNHIDWAISELGTKNFYIIGHLSCVEGYKKGIQHGYGLTLRQTSREFINANIDVYRQFFTDLAARSLPKWVSPDEAEKETSERALLRIAAQRCLEASLAFLEQLSKNEGREASIAVASGHAD